jgi:heparanase
MLQAPSGPPPPVLNPATMPRIGTVDARFQSYNIETLEVTGGNFWKPYGNPSSDGAKPVQPSSNVPSGMNPDMFQYRPPIDLTTQAGCRLGPDICARQRNVGEHYLLLRREWPGA